MGIFIKLKILSFLGNIQKNWRIILDIVVSEIFTCLKLFFCNFCIMLLDLYVRNFRLTFRLGLFFKWYCCWRRRVFRRVYSFGRWTIFKLLLFCGGYLLTNFMLLYLVMIVRWFFVTFADFSCYNIRLFPLYNIFPVTPTFNA